MSKKTWIIIGIIVVLYLIWGDTLAKANNKKCPSIPQGSNAIEYTCPAPITIVQVLTMPLQAIKEFLMPTTINKGVPKPVELINTGDTVNSGQLIESSANGKKAYSNRDFATLYANDSITTVKNLMKDEYIGIVTGQISANDIFPEAWSIDSIYIIPKVFVYLA